jgi:hypothetical protein
MQKIKNVRSPAPSNAEHNRTEVYNYYVVLKGNKHFYGSPRQLIQAALAGVA